MAESADTKHQQPVAHDSSCVAARTRPLLSCRRRRLIQPNTVTNLNGKVSAGALTWDGSRDAPFCHRAALAGYINVLDDHQSTIVDYLKHIINFVFVVDVVKT